MAFDIKLDGLKVLEKSLGILKKNNTRALRKGVAAGARVVVKKAKAMCPVSEDGNFNHPKGNLKKSIAGKPLKQKYEDKAAVIVGPRSGKRQKYDGWYGRLVEYGHHVAKSTGTYYSKRAGRTLTKYGDGGQVEPKPFLRPAELESKNEAQQVMARTYKQALIDNRQSSASLIADTIIDTIE